jgi:hypothetical protein
MLNKLKEENILILNLIKDRHNFAWKLADSFKRYGSNRNERLIITNEKAKRIKEISKEMKELLTIPIENIIKNKKTETINKKLDDLFQEYYELITTN